MTPDPLFVPRLRADLVRRDLGLEAVVWSPIRAEPAALDPVATVMLSVIDGSATVTDLARDVQEVIGLAADAAMGQVQRIVAQLDRDGLLTSSVPDQAAQRKRDLFANPPSSCMESSSCTGTVTSVNLDLGGYRLRVACTSRRVARRLRGALRAHVIADNAPLGFMVRSPRRQPRHHELVDRCGFVLGSASGTGQVLDMVGSHLSALLPLPDGRVRLRVRSLLRGDRAIICAWPLLFVPTLDEAQLVAAGYVVLDRLAIEIDLATGAMVNVPAPWFPGAPPAPALGHAASVAAPIEVERILVAAPAGTAAPTAGQLAASVAAESMHERRPDALDAALMLVDRSEVTQVDISAPDALLVALRADASRR